MSWTTTTLQTSTPPSNHHLHHRNNNNINNNININNPSSHPPPVASSTSPSRRGLSRTPRRLPGATNNIYTAASTPNLNALYSAQAARLATGLSRKASFSALTQGSLASIPDHSESYAQSQMMPPLTPSRPAMADLAHLVSVGDTVDVPGNMHGTVRFIGSVARRKGTFTGVELHPDYASRGKNSGDVDGTYYFTTTIPGAGIFLPLSKAVRRDSPPASSASSFPLTPTMSMAGLKIGTQNSTNHTPPTPSIPKFSQSVGPGRAASPQGKRPRASLPRPESPVRRMQLTPGPRQSIAQPIKPPPRFGSPTASKFGRSVQGTAMDPPKTRPRLERKPSIGPRSASALGRATSSTPLFEEDIVSTPAPQRTRPNNGSATPVSSMHARLRPPSRTTNVADEDVERLRAQLEDRDRQLKDQAGTLADMESSLTELQILIEHPDGLQMRGNSLEDRDVIQLRALLREKNEKIAMLTAEFDAHRADFRSTIDTLEMASTETERVYEKRIEELMQEIRELQERSEDVDSVARQLKQLEELVQELEEGLEDARRGEAEARGEVEFLRGEVERTRSELRREREKASTTLTGNGGIAGSASSKELEQKEDEIRGLKAIIHSLSRDSVPGDSPDSGVSMQRKPSFSRSHRHGESVDIRIAREKLEREVTDLKGLVDSKNNREEELEREIETLRRYSPTTQRASGLTIRSQDRSSIRDSKGTVILAREPRSPDGHKRGNTLDTMPESDAYSTATENSTLWCEICETAGHDILTCTNMFGPGAQSKTTGASNGDHGLKKTTMVLGQENYNPAALSPVKSKAPEISSTVKIIPNPMESGPVAGKESGVVDAAKWCAICERDGHDSVDCPFEDAF